MKLYDSLKRILTRSEKRSEQKLISKFARKFGYKFQNGRLLTEALTHRSYVYHCEDSTASNERLEFLGDSVLGLVIGSHLFNIYPDYDEGDLTKTRAVLVNETTLSRVGRECGLNDLILMSPEEEKSGGRQRSSIISDAVEAAIGAVFIDSGLEAASDFIKKVIISYAGDILSDAGQRNYKGELLEFLQSRAEAPPFYEVVSEEGPDHEKIFTVVVRTAGNITGTGCGASKKEAEQQAASVALELLMEQEKG